METLKSFIIGFFVLIAAFLALTIGSILWPIILGIGSIILFIALAVVFIVLLFYIVVLVGHVVRKGLKG